MTKKAIITFVVGTVGLLGGLYLVSFRQPIYTFVFHPPFLCSLPFPFYFLFPCSKTASEKEQEWAQYKDKHTKVPGSMWNNIREMKQKRKDEK